MDVFFTCGSGRCGTTIVRRVFSRHKKVFSFPFESRFLIDPDGLVDLYDSLKVQPSPFMVDTKVKRFKKFMKNLHAQNVVELSGLAAARLLNRERVVLAAPAYARMNLGSYNNSFLDLVDNFINDLNVESFKGTWYGNVNTVINPEVFFIPNNGRRDAKPYKQFIEGFIEPILTKKNATHWCEDTPLSLLHASSILEILPQAKFLHIYRDPRDVIASYLKQDWAPSDVRSATEFFKGIMAGILHSRSQIPSESLFEISLEELVKNPRFHIPQICSFVGLEDDEAMYELALNRSNSGRWKKEFSNEEQGYLTQALRDILLGLNYE